MEKSKKVYVKGGGAKITPHPLPAVEIELKVVRPGTKRKSTRCNGNSLLHAFVFRYLYIRHITKTYREKIMRKVPSYREEIKKS